MANCMPPGSVLDSPRSRVAMGELVERIVQADFCRALAAATFGAGCQLFVPFSLPSTRTEFFDENAGVTRCDLLASYLKFHNPHVNEATIATTCKATHPKPLLVKVPDIISHRPGRMEFYEIKPNSPSGQLSGAEKVAFFNVLCSPTVANLPYKPGTAYRPNFNFPLGRATALGASWELDIHVFWATAGLILYELCPKPAPDQPGGKCTALMRATSVAAIMRLRADEEFVRTAYTGMAAEAASPLRKPVGRVTVGPTPNDPDDVGYVQRMLNDWRGRAGLPLIAEDSDFGGETDGAIIRFQQDVTGIVDGKINVGGPAMTALEEGFFTAVLDGFTAGVGTLPAADDPMIAHDVDDESDAEVADEPIGPAEVETALRGEMRDCLLPLHGV